MATETWKDGEVFLGIYGKARIGFTATEGGPLWSVDIDTDTDGIWINGSGATLAEAAENAAQVAQAASKPFVPIAGVEYRRGQFGELDNETKFSNNTLE